MTTTGFSGAVRTGAVIVVLIAAAVLGLVAGNAIADRQGPQLNAGYPAGWQGGAAVPQSRTATAAFSLDAVQALAAIRDTTPATADEDYADYGIRHGAAAEPAERNHEPRKRAPQSSSEGDAGQQLPPGLR